MPISTSSQFDLVAQLPLRLYGTVANITARDAIPTSRRHDGFETYVISESSTYRLQGGITNTDWVLSTSASTDQYLSGVIVNSISDVDFVITHGTNIEGIDFSHTHPWSEITNTPTTESGYGITDGFTSWDKDYDDLINKPNIAYASTIGIGDLDDVDTNGIINDKILKYNSTSGNWEIADDNNTTYVSSDFDHNALINTHNLTTDIDHASITNIGTNTHAQIDNHINDSSIHFSDLSGFDTDDLAEGSANLYSQWNNVTDGINYSGGNVGIGTTNPSYKLDVAGKTNTYDLRISSSSVGGDREIELNRGGSTYGSTVYRDWKIKANGAQSIDFNYKLNNIETNLVSINFDGYNFNVNGTGRFTSKLYLGTTTAPATDTGTLNALVYDPSNGEIKQRAISLSGYVDYNQSSTTSSSTPTPTGNYKENEYYLTALAAGATFASPSGTPSNGNTLLIRIKDNGTARSLAWNSIYRAIGVTLPTTTTISKILYVGCLYNSTDSKWDVVSVVEQK